MQKRAPYAPSLVIVACDDTIEVTMDDLVVRFEDAKPILVATVRRSVAYPFLWELLRHLTSPDFWPPGASDITLPATVLESTFRQAKLIDAE